MNDKEIDRRCEAMEDALYRLKNSERLSPAEVRAVDDFMAAVGARPLAELHRLVCESREQALQPFAKVAVAQEYWSAEAMPDFSYPVAGTRLDLAMEDCPAAIGSLSPSDFYFARKVLEP